MRGCVVPKVPKTIPSTVRHATTAGITTGDITAVAAVVIAPMALSDSKPISRFLAVGQW